MTASKRPSTSSLRRFITTRPYVTIAELRRRFCLECEDVSRVERPGDFAFIGLPEREASKLQDLWQHDEVGLELSVEVRAPVVVGIYPMRIARFVQEHPTNGHVNGQSTVDGVAAAPVQPNGNANGRPPRAPSNGPSHPFADGRPTAAEPASRPMDRRGNGNLNDFASGALGSPQRP
jgi:hypothetical protein